MHITKVMATIGPATYNPIVLKKMLAQGVDIVRINMSHGNLARHATTINNIKNIAKSLKQDLKIFIDLQGPKIRVGKFKNNHIKLKSKQTFRLDPDFDSANGNEQIAHICYPELYKYVAIQDVLLLDDGKISLEVIEICGNKIDCRVKVPGVLRDNKGINLPSGKMNCSKITAKDKEDILFASQFNVDYFGLSFVNSAAQILQVQKILATAKSKAKIFAKIETNSAILNIKEILQHADGIVVARGDLGVEMGLVNLPRLQKELLRLAKIYHKPAVVITQIMDSMITNIMPTRAEVMDIANAILDGADCLGFASETAVGHHPELVIKYAVEIIEASEQISIVRS